MKPTAHQCDLPGVHWAKVSDSAVFRVLHVLFQQRSASSICNSKTAETVWRYEAERAKLTRDFHWHWRRIPFRIRSGPDLAQPVEIQRCQVQDTGNLGPAADYEQAQSEARSRRIGDATVREYAGFRG
jgi:hypothetical protein